MSRVGKRKKQQQKEIVGFERVFVIPATGREVALVQHKDYEVYPVFGYGVNWPKTAGEMNIGEFVEALLNFIDAPLEELEPILDKSETYYAAKTAVCIINSAKVAVPQTRYYLIEGLLKEDDIWHKINQSNIDDKLLKERGRDFSSVEYGIMTNYLYGFLKNKCSVDSIPCVKPDTVRYQYLAGDGIFPEQWDYFYYFQEINKKFEIFTQGWKKDMQKNGDHTKIIINIEENSKAFYYDVFVNKRRKLRKRLKDISTESKKIPKEKRPKLIETIFQRPIEGTTDITPELQLLFDHWDGLESQYVTAQLKSSRPLTRPEYEAAVKRQLKSRRKSIRIVENKAPSHPSYQRFKEFPLCCVETILNGIFMYSLLKFYANEFDQRNLPHTWVKELAALILYHDDIKNKYNEHIHKQVQRGKDYTACATIPISGHTNRDVKRYELEEIATQAKNDIAFGRFESFPTFNLEPGQFIAFYNVLKRITNTLPPKFYELEHLNYMFVRGVPMANTISYKLPEGHTEITPEDIAKIKALSAETRKERMQECQRKIEILQKQASQFMKRVYGPKEHIAHLLPWDFFFEPWLLGFDPMEAEQLDIVSAIQNPEYMQLVINNGRLWDKYKAKRFTKEKTHNILTKLRLPNTIENLIHSNNFIEPSASYTLRKTMVPSRLVYSSGKQNWASYG